MCFHSNYKWTAKKKLACADPGQPYRRIYRTFPQIASLSIPHKTYSGSTLFQVRLICMSSYHRTPQSFSSHVAVLYLVSTQHKEGMSRHSSIVEILLRVAQDGPRPGGCAGWGRCQSGSRATSRALQALPATASPAVGTAAPVARGRVAMAGGWHWAAEERVQVGADIPPRASRGNSARAVDPGASVGTTSLGASPTRGSTCRPLPSRAG